MTVDLKLANKSTDELKHNIRNYLNIRKTMENKQDKKSFLILAKQHHLALRHRIPKAEYKNYARWIHLSR